MRSQSKNSSSSLNSWLKLEITSSGLWDVSEIKLEFLNAKFLSVFWILLDIKFFVINIEKKCTYLTEFKNTSFTL